MSSPSCSYTAVSFFYYITWFDELGGQLSIGVRTLFDHEPHVEKVIDPVNMEAAISSILDLK